MLVLTRKTDEQILIGENIKITLVRVRGNSVRIGIEAPRDVRVVRGELDATRKDDSPRAQEEVHDLEQVFAHPESQVISGRAKVGGGKLQISLSKETLRSTAGTSDCRGQVNRADDATKLHRRPLAGFLSAT